MAAVRQELVALFGTLAREERVAHSYVLVSQDTVSLDATARACLQAIDGEHRLQLADGLIVAIEGTSIGIDTVRDVREHLAAFPGVAKYRTALLPQAELLTPEAQNALLKVAEEPAPHSVLLLATRDEERLLPTLRSRLQRIAIPPLDDTAVATWLVTQGIADSDASVIAGKAHGSLSLALELAATSDARRIAQNLLLAPASQVAAIAKAAAAEEISLTDLLRALATELAYTQHTARTRELWHRVQRLLAQASVSPLSLRLQIAALFSDLP